jgi:CBS domain-containing protein
MQVREILRVKGSALFTATPRQDLSDAVAAMNENDVGSLVVMSGGKMVGMLTFREIIAAVHHRKAKLDALTVADVMVANPVTAGPDMEADDLRRLLVDQHMRYLPIMDGDMLLGVVSFLDVAKAVLEERNFENRMLKNYIKNWPTEDAKP